MFEDIISKSKVKVKECDKCGTKESRLWYNKDGNIMCEDCFHGEELQFMNT